MLTLPLYLRWLAFCLPVHATRCVHCSKNPGRNSTFLTKEGKVLILLLNSDFEFTTFLELCCWWIIVTAVPLPTMSSGSRSGGWVGVCSLGTAKLILVRIFTTLTYYPTTSWCSFTNLQHLYVDLWLIFMTGQKVDEAISFVHLIRYCCKWRLVGFTNTTSCGPQTNIEYFHCPWPFDLWDATASERVNWRLNLC